MKAREIMTENPRCATPDMSVQEAARMMKAEDTGVLPVVDASNSRRLVGVLTDRDIAIRVVAEGRPAATVREVMSAGVRTASVDDSVEDVMRVMADEQVRRIPIVDDAGTVVGIVSQADLVREGPDRRAEKTIERISQPGGAHNH
jgi:CBS domain-containing protein